MDRTLLNFFIIIVADLVVFLISLYVWSLKRKKIIGFIHTGFSGLLMKYYRKQKEGSEFLDQPDDVYQIEVKRPYLFADPGIQHDEHRRYGSHSLLSSCHERPNSMYIASHETRADDATGEVTRKKPKNEKKPWWKYLLVVDDRKIRNNEAVLYLRFMRSTCMMLLLCSLVALVSNCILCIHLAVHKKPYFIATYMLEDLLNCKFTIWTLYFTTWVYSIIVYVYILNFRSMVNKGRQITVILRPQLHTIMLLGFEKTLTDPEHIYKYFDKHFPEHVLSANIILNHSKRMALEEQLEATKAQITFCKDMSLIIPWKPSKSHNFRRTESPQSNQGSSNQSTHCKEERGYRNNRRSLSCGMLKKNDDLSLVSQYHRGGYRRSKSSSDIKALSKGTRKKDASIVERNQSPAHNVGFFEYLKEWTMQWRSIKNRNHGSDDKFSKLLKRVKELKLLIDQETKRKHTTSTRVSFVSFADPRLVLHILKDRRILEDMPTWRIHPAPHPREIVWKNIHLSSWYIVLRVFFYNTLLVIFYTAVTWVISHLNLLKSVRIVSKTGRVEAETVNIDDISQSTLYNAMMPPMVMAFLNSCVHPFMINTVSRVIGFWTQSNYQKYLLFCHVFYLIISTILIPLLASMLAFWKIFDGAFDSLSLDLGRVLVSTSWRFSTIYVFNATFLGSSNQLLQLSQIATRSLGIYFFKYDIGMTNFDFGYWYAFHLSILTLVMLFSVFIPYLPFLGVLYFAVRYCVDRHNIVHHVLQLPLDSTGKISESAVKSMLLCISITQFAMSGVFLNCQDVLPPLCITMLYIASVATWLVLYASNADTMVETTESLHRLKLRPLNKIMMETIKLCYMHPCDSKDLMESRK